jgi:hypothetical protein
MGASAGDLLARDVVCDWLDGADCAYDVALARPFSGGVDWQDVAPERYTHVVFVCGPFGNGPPLDGFLKRFEEQHLCGVNLTMLDSLETWNPFDVLWERDSSQRTRPDLVFLSPPAEAPVVGVVRIDAQPEYGSRDRIDAANRAIERLLVSREVASVPVDTRLDVNQNGYASAAQIESVLGRMDAVITTRLHGMVLALKRGVPVVAIDAVAGGDKVTRQAQEIGWPHCLNAETVTDAQLQQALDFCLSSEGAKSAAECCQRSRGRLSNLREEFLESLHSAGGVRR